MSFRYDDKEHQYYLDECPIQSVTQMLTELDYYDTDFIHEFYSERGTALHNTMKLKLLDELDEDALYRDEVDGYTPLTPWLPGMANFIKNHSPEWETLNGEPVLELPLYHKVYHYGFTSDFLGSLTINDDRYRCCADWKFHSVMNKSTVAVTGRQLCGYVEGLMSHMNWIEKKPHRVLVHFSPKLKSGYSLHFCDNETDYVAWRSIMNVCMDKRSIGV